MPEAAARRILEARKHDLLALSEKLLEQEVVDGDELRAMLEHVPPVTPTETEAAHPHEPTK